MQQRGEEQSDRPLPHDEYALLRVHRALGQALEARIGGLDESGPLETHAVRDPLYAATHDPVHQPHVLGEAAAGGLVTGSHADLPIRGALRVVPIPAVVAVEAWNVVEKADAIADLKIGYIVPYGSNRARRFVPVDAGRREQVVFDLLEVGVTDAATVHPHEQFART